MMGDGDDLESDLGEEKKPAKKTTKSKKTKKNSKKA